MRRAAAWPAHQLGKKQGRRKHAEPCLKHGVGDTCGARRQDTKPHSWKAVRVVALVCAHFDAIGQCDAVERTAAGKNCFAVRPHGGLFRAALAVAGGVRQRENDRLVDMFGHLAHCTFGKHLEV